MLSLGPGSTCDVCLEPFGHELKAPCSIQCGHVFCVECLNHIARPQCPLCRTPFDSHSFIRLHVDVDNVQRGSPQARPACATAADQEARRLQDAIANIANSGSTEAHLRQLIAECRSFLSTQPRSMFPELRVTHRMIAYLCEIKTSLRSQTQACNSLQEQVSQLGSEKEDFEKRIRELLETRKYEKETALAVEMSLREHCSRAHEAYETMVDQYNFVVQEWMRLQEEVRLLRLPPLPPPETTIPDMPDTDMDPDVVKTPQPRPMANLDQGKLKGAALQKPESYLISPLPEFTGRLPDAVALPDEEEEAQDSLKGTSKSQRQEKPQLVYQPFAMPSTPPSNKCDAAGHPYTCDCEDFEVFGEDQKKSGSRRPSFTAHSVSTPAVDVKMKVPPSTPSTLSYSTPLSPGRTRSYTIPSHTSRPPSRVPSRPSSPSPNYPASYMYTPSSGLASFPQSNNESLRTRLHDLLQDDSSVSSSLPNLSSTHFPSSFSRDTPQSSRHVELSSRPPSRSGSSSSKRRVNTHSSPERGGDSERSRSSPQAGASSAIPPPPTPVPPVSASPNHLAMPSTGLSRASSAAMAIEKERKEKKEQERERRRIEKEKKRAMEQESLARSNSVSGGPGLGASVTNGAGSVYGHRTNNGASGRESGFASASPQPPRHHPSAGTPMGLGGGGGPTMMPSTLPSIYSS